MYQLVNYMTKKDYKYIDINIYIFFQADEMAVFQHCSLSQLDNLFCMTTYY